MVESNALDVVFQALADRTRRAMLGRLARGEATVSELAAPFEMSLAAVSKHVKALEKAGLVKRRVEGRTHYCRLEAKPLGKAASWLDHYARFWDERLGELEREMRRSS
jgi:DNA-binding transcriptional ArsR family regulator